jgi:hypothetical protein
MIANALSAECDALKAENERLLSAMETVRELYAEKIEGLERERDEWCEKWQRMRTMYAELRFPGMKGIVRLAESSVPAPQETPK